MYINIILAYFYLFVCSPSNQHKSEKELGAKTLTERHLRREVTALSCVTSHLSTLPNMLNNRNTSGQCYQSELLYRDRGTLGFISCCS